MPIIQENNIPNTQCGFRIKHNTIHHRITDKISMVFEEKKIYPEVFLDSGQAFNRIWYDGLLFKVKSFLLPAYYLIIKSFLENKSFVVRLNN